MVAVSYDAHVQFEDTIWYTTESEIGKNVAIGFDVWYMLTIVT